MLKLIVCLSLVMMLMESMKCTAHGYQADDKQLNSALKILINEAADNLLRDLIFESSENRLKKIENDYFVSI